MKIEIDITDQMAGIVEFVRHQSEIDFEVQQVSDLLASDVRLVVDIAEWGWEDTEVKSRIIGLVTDRFLGRRWPTYGEKLNLRAFIDQLKKAAEAQGYHTLRQAKLDEANEETPSANRGTGPGVFMAERFSPPFPMDEFSFSPLQHWAFTTQEIDVAVRTAVYASLDGPLARNALVQAFPDGSAKSEVHKRVDLLQAAKKEGKYHELVTTVIEEIAQEVVAIGKMIGVTPLRSTAVVPIKSGMQHSPSGPPWFATLVLPDGSRQDILFNGTGEQAV